MIVIKVGGGEGINYDYICEDIAKLVKKNEKIVLVHGGSHEANVVSEKLGKPPRFVTSISGYESRYTDRDTLGIFAMVYSGKANKFILLKTTGLLQCERSAVTIFRFLILFGSLHTSFAR